ncbi:XTP/dITP diphosphatase [Thermosulfurimonas dismutans]|uniref:dITP/XTP pyrophosphatase n=1 Tax=Thermosulfurimonas dismutans TaxID=999894 RepID=A0A179D533_9BACT|nr:XTP/dITP diphosphatase [Thermosulfurimonas dismutans]OAQ21195.1 Nucleoside 5-triphosphatase RdgB (dHAPTP, dITP, XTP-specific) [Thermosulfurimonas dismutans]
MRRKTLVLATKNQGKIRELKTLLKDLPLKILTPEDFPEIKSPEEIGQSFFDNAFLKARHWALATGQLALADDSGLEVDALRGAPGIYSARYAGPSATDEENIRKLLEEMKDVPWENRTGRFRCVIIIYHPSGRWLKAEGVWEGLIATSPRGEEGFGYDPVFLPLEFDFRKTAAEISPETKNRLSHRGRALAALIELLPDFLQAL